MIKSDFEISAVALIKSVCHVHYITPENQYLTFGCFDNSTRLLLKLDSETDPLLKHAYRTCKDVYYTRGADCYNTYFNEILIND